jgi:hypothetical protein
MQLELSYMGVYYFLFKIRDHHLLNPSFFWWYRFKKSHDLFILGVSDSECPLCCQSEPMLKELQDLFHSDKFLHKGKRILIARLDTKNKPTFLEKDDIVFESVPKVVIIR